MSSRRKAHTGPSNSFCRFVSRSRLAQSGNPQAPQSSPTARAPLRPIKTTAPERATPLASRSKSFFPVCSP